MAAKGDGWVLRTNPTPTTMLNREQQLAVAAVKGGRNLFLTGAGGTGKSHTIRAICDWAAGAGIRYAVTAMTGCAALLLNMGAKTLHSWAGIGLAREAPHVLAEAVRQNKRAARRWLDTQLLIIDEVSMMTPELLEKLDLVARRVRKQTRTRFGGLQIVLAGDFCQLPPVTKGADVSGGGELRFLFEVPLWRELIDETVELVEIRRQLDPVFQQILTEARMGRLTPESIHVLEERMNLPWQDNEIKPTLLFTRNAEVDTVNRRNMEVLDGHRQTYEVQTVVMDKPGKGVATLISPDDPDVAAALERLDTDAPYDPNLTLCVGAQVMLIVNMDQDRGLVNGSRGVVTGYTLGGLPIVRFLSCNEPVIVDRANWWLTDYEGIGRTQIPLKIAYAITVHKAQGSTLDSALVDVGSSTFEFGQAYVALSRVRSLFGLYVWKLDPRKIRCHPAVVEYYEALAAARNPIILEPQGPNSSGSSNCASTDDDPAAASPWTLDGLSPAWLTLIEAYMDSPTGVRLADQITQRTAVAPQPEDVFAALRACPDPAAVKVLIVGQDPYHTPGMAHGLAFSVRSTVAKLPPSLVNIFKELETDLGTPAPTSGCLTGWATQGVLLLNTLLTVSHGSPLSHAGMGWEDLTTQLIAATLAASPHTVVIAWGRPAQKKLEHASIRPLLAKHTVIQAPHPSPLSAHSGFFGSRPFSKANAALQAHGQESITWV
jgi:ATP-dependent DNA helicase PIF1